MTAAKRLGSIFPFSQCSVKTHVSSLQVLLCDVLHATHCFLLSSSKHSTALGSDGASHRSNLGSPASSGHRPVHADVTLIARINCLLTARGHH